MLVSIKGYLKYPVKYIRGLGFHDLAPQVSYMYSELGKCK